MKICNWEGCENYCEGNTDYCATHNHLRRKIERESLKEKKIHVIPKVSEKMKKELATFAVKKKKHLEAHPDCQIRLVGCTNQNNTVHHSAKRGKNLNNEDTFMTACDHCHDQVEFVLSAKERREKGFLK